MIKFICNNSIIESDLPPAYSLLDYLRNDLSLKGTKEGCREGDCGACTVLMGTVVDNEIKYKTINSCLTPLASCYGKHIVTIEGLKQRELNLIQQQFIESTATQCGFCTPGFIVSISGYLLSAKTVNYDDAIAYIAGNICRCTGHISIKNAVKNIITSISDEFEEDKFLCLTNHKIIPEYFTSIKKRLTDISSNINIENNGSKSIRIAGGTDIMLQKGENISDLEVQVMPSKSEDNIIITDSCINIKSETTISEIEESENIASIYPELNYFLKLFGSKQIRNLATVAGNIVNASPIADMVNILLALNAGIIISNSEKKRDIPLKDFYLGYKKYDLQLGEYIENIIIPLPKRKYYFNYEKISRRIHLDIASVNSTLYMVEENNEIKQISISAGGIAPYPFMLKQTAEFLLGKNITSKILQEASNVLTSEINPISDVRGSKEYKSLLLKQLFFTHFEKKYPELVEAVYE